MLLKKKSAQKSAPNQKVQGGEVNIPNSQNALDAIESEDAKENLKTALWDKVNKKINELTEKTNELTEKQKKAKKKNCNCCGCW